MGYITNPGLAGLFIAFSTSTRLSRSRTNRTAGIFAPNTTPIRPIDYSSPRLTTSTTKMTSPPRVEHFPTHDDPEKASPASQEEIPPRFVRSWLARQFRHHFKLLRLWLVGQVRRHPFWSATVLCLALVGIIAGVVHWSYGDVPFASGRFVVDQDGVKVADGVSFSLISLAPVGFEPMQHIVGRTPWT